MGKHYSNEFKQKIAAATGSLTTKSYDGTICPLYGNDCSGFVNAAWGIIFNI